MSLRVKLFAISSLAVVAAVGIMAWSVDRYEQRQIQESDQQHSAALVAQFQSELAQRGAEVSASVQGIADAESTLRMVLDLNRPQADPSMYVHDARGLASSHQLDFLELASNDGKLISSAQWPERVGYKEDLVNQSGDWSREPAFLNRVEMSDRVALGLIAVRVVRAGGKSFYIIGGRRLDSEFLRNLAMPAGMRALLYRNLETSFVPASLSDAEGPFPGAESFAPLVEALQKQPAGSQETVEWTSDFGTPERFISLPLRGRQGELLAALLVGSSQGQLVTFQGYIRGLAFAIAGAGIFLAFLLGWWAGARVTGPLARLAGGMAEVSAGDWDAQVKSRATPEVRRVLSAFNRMTTGLSEERAAQIARERAAAGRELAAQLASELKASLAPFEKVVQSLQQKDAEASRDGREESSGDSENEFGQPLPVLGQSLEALEATSGRLKEFASLPAPRLESVNLGEIVRAAVQTMTPRFSSIGRPPVTPELFLDERMAAVRADAALLRKALDYLLSFLLEDMPAGGTLTIRMFQRVGMAHMILSDTGTGSLLEPQDPGRTLSPYRAARAPGAALRLAMVQSIISGHAGRISIESARGTGTTFFLDLPTEGLAPMARPESEIHRVPVKSIEAESEAPRESRDVQSEQAAEQLEDAAEPQPASEIQNAVDGLATAQQARMQEEEPRPPLGISLDEEIAEESLFDAFPEDLADDDEVMDEAEEENWSALAEVLHEAQIRLMTDQPAQLESNAGPEFLFDPPQNFAPAAEQDHDSSPAERGEREERDWPAGIDLSEESLLRPEPEPASTIAADEEADVVPAISLDEPAMEELVHQELTLKTDTSNSETPAEIESKRIWITYR